jgi:hypothetical protein
MKAVVALAGLVLIIASIWAGAWLVEFAKDAWYAVPAIITVWAVRLLGLALILGAFHDESVQDNDRRKHELPGPEVPGR